MTLGQGSRVNLPKQQEVEKIHKISRKKYTKKKTGENPEFIKCTKKKYQIKQKKSETAKTKISGLNNRVRCNKNTKLTKKEQNTKAYSAPKSQQQELVKIGKP